MFSCEFYQIFQNAVFAKHLWVTVSAKYPFLFVPSPQPQEIFLSTLVILNVFETNTVKCLRTALCGGPRQTVSCDKVDLLLIEQVICPRCCCIPEVVAQLSSVKMRFCKTSEISQKSSLQLLC